MHPGSAPHRSAPTSPPRRSTTIERGSEEGRTSPALLRGGLVFQLAQVAWFQSALTVVRSCTGDGLQSLRGCAARLSFVGAPCISTARCEDRFVAQERGSGFYDGGIATLVGRCVCDASRGPCSVRMWFHYEQHDKRERDLGRRDRRRRHLLVSPRRKQSSPSTPGPSRRLRSHRCQGLQGAVCGSATSTAPFRPVIRR